MPPALPKGVKGSLVAKRSRRERSSGMTSKKRAVASAARKRMPRTETAQPEAERAAAPNQAQGSTSVFDEDEEPPRTRRATTKRNSLKDMSSSEDGQSSSDESFAPTTAERTAEAEATQQGGATSDVDMDADLDEELSAPTRPKRKAKTAPKTKSQRKKYMERYTPEETKKLVQTFRDIIPCPKECGAVGRLKLSGTSTSNKPMVSCGACNSKSSGRALEATIASVIPAETEPSTAIPSTQTAGNPTAASFNAFAAKMQAEMAELRKLVTKLSQENSQLRLLVGSLQNRRAPVTAPLVHESHIRPARIAPTQSAAPTEPPAEPHLTAATQAEAPESTSWSEVVRKNLRINQLEPRMAASVKALRKATEAYRPERRINTASRPPNRPPLEVQNCYFRCSRGPIGKLRRALREALPSTALLHMSFIGNNTLEILCAKEHVGRLTFTMRKAQMPDIKGATLLMPFNSNASQDGFSDERKLNNARLTLKRVSAIASSEVSYSVRTWFQKAQEKLESEIARLEPQASTDEASTIAPSTTEEGAKDTAPAVNADAMDTTMGEPESAATPANDN